MAKRRAAKPTPRKSTKRATSTKSEPKKSSTKSRKQSAAKSPARKPSTKKSTKSARSAAAKKGWETRRARELAGRSPYEKRNANAIEHGYENYWDERQSRVRVRKALSEKYGILDPSIAEIDEFGTLGRGDSARELYYKTKRLMEKYQPAPTDREIWALIRIFYKPRSRR